MSPETTDNYDDDDDDDDDDEDRGNSYTEETREGKAIESDCSPLFHP